MSAASASVLSAIVLPPALGPGDDQQRALGRELDVDRHDAAGGIAPGLRQQQRMTGQAQGDASFAIDRRRGGLHALGRVSPGQHPVQLADRLHERLDLAPPGPDRVGELTQDAGRLLLFFAERLDQLVVGLHGRLGLDEDRLTTLRAVVNDAAHPLAGLGPHRQHVAPVTHGHEPVGEETVALGLEHALEVGDDPPPPVAHLVPERSEPRARRDR